MKTQTFPTLYGVAKNGKMKEWSVSVKGGPKNEGAYITTKHGYCGQSMHASNRTVLDGKNVGRANATSSFEQAVLEAKAAWERKRDSGYTDSIDSAHSAPIRPMLAHDYTKHSSKITFPCYMQPKLNGVRCIATRVGDRIVFMSRNNKEFEVLQNHKDLIKELVSLMSDGESWDGEIYVHGWKFQDIVSALTALSAQTKRLQYHVYDVVDTSKDFKSRYPKAHVLGVFVKFVHTLNGDTPNDANKWQKLFVEQGYEGLMLRNKKGMYVPNYRSYDLQKYKTFIDEEFDIVGASYDVEGGVIWHCSSKYADPFGDNIFSVRPMGTLASRRKMWEQCSKYFGKKLTVKYQELSADGLPIFPVGIGVRNFE